MSDRKLGSGFRFTRLMAWGPVLILLLGLIFVLRGDMVVGLLLGGAALVFWFVVRRRKSQTAP